MITRRNAILSTLFGTGMIGLRSLATGLPASLLLNPRKALADMPSSPNPAAQFSHPADLGRGRSDQRQRPRNVRGRGRLAGAPAASPTAPIR